MDKKIIVKTIISCLLGAVLWCGVYFVICQVKQQSFVDTFFTAKNLIELAVCMIAAGVAYYLAQKKKNS